MDELIEILSDCCPGIDFETEKGLVDDGILESLDIVMIVGELMAQYDVEITPDDILPEHFNSAEAIYRLLQRLQEEA